MKVKHIDLEDCCEHFGVSNCVEDKIERLETLADELEEALDEIAESRIEFCDTCKSMQEIAREALQEITKYNEGIKE